MLKWQRILVSLALAISFPLVGAVIGLWWPVRHTDHPWAGDGIGMLVSGLLGLISGVAVGSGSVAWFLLASRFRSRRP